MQVVSIWNCNFSLERMISSNLISEVSGRNKGKNKSFLSELVFFEVSLKWKNIIRKHFILGIQITLFLKRRKLIALNISLSKLWLLETGYQKTFKYYFLFGEKDLEHELSKRRLKNISQSSVEVLWTKPTKNVF